MMVARPSRLAGAVLLLCGLRAGAALADEPVPWPDTLRRGANLTVQITEKDLAHYARDWQANSCRVLINDLLPPAPPHRVSEEKKKQVFDALDLCLKYGLFTVFSPSASFDNNDRFFSNPEYRKAYVDFWEETARRYRDAGPIAWDLMNEPHDRLARTEWNAFARELTAAIRRIDPKHTLVVEPPEWGWAGGFQYLEPTGDPNTVYSFHFYGPMDFTHQRHNGHMKATEEQWKQRVYPGSTMQGEVWDRARLRKEIEKAAAFRDRHGVRIWCGEFGVARWAQGALPYMTDWIELCEAEKIGWCYYSYREWAPMDLEMDPAVRGGKTERAETDFVRLFKKYFARKD
jgi:hypothetical protein